MKSLDDMISSNAEVRPLYGDTDSVYYVDPDAELFYEPWPAVDLEGYVPGLGFALAMRQDECSRCHKDLRVIKFAADLKGRPPTKKVAFHRTAEEGAACRMLHMIQKGGRV